MKKIVKGVVMWKLYCNFAKKEIARAEEMRIQYFEHKK